MADEESRYTVTEADADTVDGRCHAMTSGGKRCPNAALPNSMYCGIPSHQALATADEK